MSSQFLTLIFIILVSIQLSPCLTWTIWSSKSTTQQPALIAHSDHYRSPLDLTTPTDVTNETPSSPSKAEPTESSTSTNTEIKTTTTEKIPNSKPSSPYEPRDLDESNKGESEDASSGENPTNFTSPYSVNKATENIIPTHTYEDKPSESTTSNEEYDNPQNHYSTDKSNSARSVNGSGDHTNANQNDALNEENSTPNKTEASPTPDYPNDDDETESYNGTATDARTSSSSTVTINEMEINSTHGPRNIMNDTESYNVTSTDVTANTDVQTSSSSTITNNATEANSTHGPRSVMNDTESYEEASEIGAKVVSGSFSITYSKSALSFLFFWVIFLF